MRGCVANYIRLAAYSGVSLTGTVLVVWAMNRHLSASWVAAAYNQISCIAHLAPLIAFVYILDRSGDRFLLAFCRRTGRLCCMAFAAALVFGLNHARGMMVAMMLVAGVLGVLVTVPGGDLVQRTRRQPCRAGLTALGMASYFTNSLSSMLWEQYGVNIDAAMVGIVRLCSADVEAAVIPYRGGHAVLLQSSTMTLLISESCNAFLFYFLFISLIATICIAAPLAVSQLLRLVGSILMIAVFVALANEARMADLFCYGDWVVRTLGRSTQVDTSIDRYHEVGAAFISVWTLLVFLLTAVAAVVDIRTGMQRPATKRPCMSVR